MITLNDLQDLIGNTFLDGNSAVAGIMLYCVVLAIIFALSKRNVTTGLIIALPSTLVFNMLGILPSDVMILLIIVTVLGLAYSTRSVWRD